MLVAASALSLALTQRMAGSALVLTCGASAGMVQEAIFRANAAVLGNRFIRVFDFFLY